MKLTDIENPQVMDLSKPLYIKTNLGRAKVVGYTPEMPQIDSIYGPFKFRAHWHVLISGDAPGHERQVLDGEIIN